jgi:hypothetical protein
VILQDNAEAAILPLKSATVNVFQVKMTNWIQTVLNLIKMNVYNVQEVSILILIKFVLKLILFVLVSIQKQVNALTAILGIK